MSIDDNYMTKAERERADAQPSDPPSEAIRAGDAKKREAVFLDCAAGPPGSEQGDRPILVEENTNCAECGSIHDIEKCPKCGSFIELGFGLAFGGFGEYKYCASETCDWFWKRESDD